MPNCDGTPRDSRHASELVRRSGMKFMLFMITDTSLNRTTADSEVDAWVDEVEATGKRVIGSVLGPLSSATVLRVRDGQRVLTDGPFARTQDWICGFEILDADDLDDAIEIASRHPM